MKPRYVLYKGRPERVGRINGIKVVLVPVDPMPRPDGSVYCNQCRFVATGCAPIDDSREALGKDCTAASNLVYKEVS